MQNDSGVLEKNSGPDLPLLFHMHKIWSAMPRENY